MLQLSEVRTSTRFISQRKFSTADIITASILAVLSGGEGTDRETVWKYEQVQKFIVIHRHFLQTFLPSLKCSLPLTETTVRTYLTKYVVVEEFASLFTTWTMGVHKYTKLANPCNEETARIGFGMSPNKIVFLAAHAWGCQNSKAREIIRRMFTPDGEAEILTKDSNRVDYPVYSPQFYPIDLQ